MVYPLVMAVLLGGATRFRMIGMLLGGACLAVLAWRIHLVQSPNFSADWNDYASDTRIDSMIYGCILALIKNPIHETDRPARPSVTEWAILSAAAVTLLLTRFHDPLLKEGLRFSIQGIALMPLFYFAIRFADHPLFRWLNSPLAVRLGIYSYAIYLIHFVVIAAISANMPSIATNSFIVFAVALLVSIAYAAAIDRFVDGYFRRLRHEFRPVSGKAPINGGTLR